MSCTVRIWFRHYWTTFFTREEISDALKNVYDLERLTGRVAFGNINGRQMRQLGQSLSQVPKIIQLLDSSDDEILQNYADDIVDLSDLGQKNNDGNR